MVCCNLRGGLRSLRAEALCADLRIRWGRDGGKDGRIGAMPAVSARNAARVLSQVRRGARYWDASVTRLGLVVDRE